MLKNDIQLSIYYKNNPRLSWSLTKWERRHRIRNQQTNAETTAKGCSYQLHDAISQSASLPKAWCVELAYVHKAKQHQAGRTLREGIEVLILTPAQTFIKNQI